MDNYLKCPNCGNTDFNTLTLINLFEEKNSKGVICEKCNNQFLFTIKQNNEEKGILNEKPEKAYYD